MRVLWLSHFVPFPPTGHGALQRSHHLLRQVAKAAQTGCVAFAPSLTPAIEREAQSDFASTATFLDLVRPRFAGRTRKAICAVLAAVTARSYWEYWLRDSGLAATIEYRMRQLRPDVLVADTVLLAGYVKRVTAASVAVTHHNIESELIAQRAKASGPGIRWFWKREARKLRRLEEWAAGHAAVNIMVSEADEATFRRAYPHARTTTIPNGVDIAFFRPDPSVVPTPGSLVFAGGMDWYPNRLAMEWFAADIWPVLRQGNAERTVTVIGRNPPEALRQLGRSDSRVRVTGFVDDVRPYISGSAIYICPIQVGGGTRLKILDALAMERPLLSTGLGVSGIGLVEDVHYLRAETPAEFLHQVNRLEQDVSLARDIAARGAAFVRENYGWQVIGDRLVAALRRTVPVPSALKAHVSEST